MYSSLPKQEKTIEIDLIGETTGEHYKGSFTVRTVLSMAGRHALELEKTRLAADYANPSNGLAAISTILANIRAKTIKAPSWWTDLGNGSDILDENVTLNIYDQILQSEADWKDLIAKKAEEAKKEQEADDKAKEESEGK